MWKYTVRKVRFEFDAVRNTIGRRYYITGYIIATHHNVYNPPFKYPLISYTICGDDRRKYSVELLDGIIYSVYRWDQIIGEHAAWVLIYSIKSCKVEM